MIGTEIAVISPHANAAPNHISFLQFKRLIPQTLLRHHSGLGDEHLRLCWPKPPFIQPNTAFSTALIKEGPQGPCCVSLYAVDDEYYQKIQDWLKA